MAWTGTATVAKVSDRLFRVTGLSLAGAASGTIGFSDKTVAAEVSLEAPTWQPYRNSENDLISLQDAISTVINVVTDVTDAVPISIVKSGTTHLDFAMTFHNDSAATVSAALEIYIEFH